MQDSRRHDGSRAAQSLQPGRGEGVHPAQRAAGEGGGEGACEEEMNHNEALEKFTTFEDHRRLR